MIQIPKHNRKAEAFKKIIDAGASLAGGVGTGLVGGIFTGTDGIFIGASYGVLLTEVLKNAGSEIIERYLGSRQTIRIGANFIYASRRIEERLLRGDKLREESFFKNSQQNRSAAEEILEGALLLAQNEYEELKVRHYGYLLANIYFDSTIDQAFANFLLRSAEKLSYRQFCLLEVFFNSEEYNFEEQIKPIGNNRTEYINNYINGIVSNSGEESKPANMFMEDLKSEINDLVQLNLIDRLPPRSSAYQWVRLTRIGVILRDLMVLDELHKNHVLETGLSLKFNEFEVNVLPNA
jgi:hypothetical protein